MESWRLLVQVGGLGDTLVIIVGQRIYKMLLIDLLILLMLVEISSSTSSSNIVITDLGLELIVLNSLSWSCWVGGKIVGVEIDLLTTAWHI